MLDMRVSRDRPLLWPASRKLLGMSVAFFIGFLLYQASKFHWHPWGFLFVLGPSLIVSGVVYYLITTKDQRRNITEVYEWWKKRLNE